MAIKNEEGISRRNTSFGVTSNSVSILVSLVINHLTLVGLVTLAKPIDTDNSMVTARGEGVGTGWRWMKRDGEEKGDICNSVTNRNNI